MKLSEYILQPVGIVHSSITKPEDMPSEGVAAKIEVYDRFKEALNGIEEYSHIIVLLFFHQAERSPLKVMPRRGALILTEKGVFATRSPTRPNPIAINVAKVLSREGPMLVVDALDAIDGTPIVDIKPYLPGWDCVFSAKTGDRFSTLQKLPKDDVLLSMMREASNFHGDVCAGVAIGVRIVYKSFEILKCDPRSHDLKITLGTKACISDGVQALTGSTNKRLRTKGCVDQTVTFHFNGRNLQFTLSDSKKFRRADEVLAAPDCDLFARIKDYQSEQQM